MLGQLHCLYVHSKAEHHGVDHVTEKTVQLMVSRKQIKKRGIEKWQKQCIAFSGLHPSPRPPALTHWDQNPEIKYSTHEVRSLMIQSQFTGHTYKQWCTSTHGLWESFKTQTMPPSLILFSIDMVLVSVLKHLPNSLSNQQ